MEAFCKLDVNPFGPDHVYVAFPKVVEVKFKVAPAHIGLLLDASGAGILFTNTRVVPGSLLQPAKVATNE